MRIFKKKSASSLNISIYRFFRFDIHFFNFSDIYLRLGTLHIHGRCINRQWGRVNIGLLFLLLFIWNRGPRVSSFRSPKMLKWQGKNLGYTEDVEVFPSQIYEPYASLDWQYGDGRYHAKWWFRPTAFKGVSTLSRVPTPSAIKKRTTALFSS